MSSRRRTASLVDLSDPARTRGRIYDGVLQIVGATPLVRPSRLITQEGLHADLALKLELFAPTGSIKDRIARGMIERAERQGEIAPGRTTIIEPTSGNAGVALACAGAAKGYSVIIVMPDGASPERRKLLALFGAKVENTPAKQGIAGAIARAGTLAARIKGGWLPGQFDNSANADTHAATTAEEIWADTEGRVDAIFAGVGTGGTLAGIARALKPRRPELRVIAVEPAESAVLSGDDPGPHQIQGIGAGFVPALLDTSQIDEIARASEREAVTAARRCAATDGIAIGLSSGAVLHAMLRTARLPASRNKLLVGIAASGAERYLSTILFDGL